MRFEWRKLLERDYAQDMEDHREKAAKDQKDLKTGPTTLGVLGTYYSAQLQRQKMAEAKMENRCAQQADVINAPTLKAVTQETMGNCLDRLIAPGDIDLEDDQAKREA